eukprot:4467354-Ditylum_brightwellii.AAC.1
MAMEEDNKNLAIEIIKKDNVDNCWKSSPCSVYSHTEIDSTQSSSVSAITDQNKTPKKNSKPHHDKSQWEKLDQRTEALENVAKEFTEAEEKAQIDIEEK